MKKMMKYSGRWTLSVTSIILLIAFSSYFFNTTPLKHLDTVFLFENVLNILDNGLPTSNTVSSWIDVLRDLSKSPEIICKSDLRPNNEAYNIFNNHAYTILYPISVFTLFVSPELTFAVLNALSHLLLLFIPYLFLKSRGVSFSLRMAFLTGIAFYSGWSYSAIGDYYLDRLYMPFALMSLFSIYQIERSTKDNISTKNWLFWVFILSTVLAALCTERSAIMMAGEIAFFMAFSSPLRKNSKTFTTLITILTLILTYVATYYYFFYESIEGGGSVARNLINGVLTLSDRLDEPGIAPFFIINILFVGLLAPFAGIRLCMLTVGALIPNVLISIGGAELNGWSTHYHTMYIPFLILLATIGYSNFTSRFDKVIGRRYIFLITAGYFFFTGWVNPYSGKFEGLNSASIYNGIIGKFYRYYFSPKESYERIAPEIIQSLNKEIPEKTKVSAIEGVMPTLYKTRTIYMYPLGMDEADYVVISGTASENKVTSVNGAVTYLGSEASKILNNCLFNRLIENGFTLHKSLTTVDILIFKKTNNKQ